MAKSAKLTIVEVNHPVTGFSTLNVIEQAEHIVPTGSLSPNAIHVPGIYVDRIVPATFEKRIEIVTLAKDDNKPSDSSLSPEKAAAIAQRHRIAKRAAKEIKDGFFVNLGIGMPTLVPEYLEPGVKVWLQSENGILGMGPYPTEKQLDAQVSHFFPVPLVMSNSSTCPLCCSVI